MVARQRQPGAPCDAFTLVEMLLALTLMAAVLTVVARVTVQVVRAEQAAESRRLHAAYRQRPFDQLEVDLASCLRVDQAVTIECDAQRQPRVRLLCLAALPADDGRLINLPYTITYRLERSLSDASSWRWLRAAHCLTHGGDSSTIELADDVATLIVERFAQGHWLNAANTPNQGNESIEALRVTLQRRDDERPLTRTLTTSSCEPPGAGHAR